LEGVKKVLLTATPIQNNLLELYGLSTVLDEYLFGDIKSFRESYMRENNIEELKERLKGFMSRTLRKNVTAYISYTERYPITRRFFVTDEEQSLYEMISDFLERESSFAIPKSQRKLITLVIRKILASSTKSIIGTFEMILERLEKIKNNENIEKIDVKDIDEDFYFEIEEEQEDFEFEIGIKTEEDLSKEKLEKILLEQEIKEIKEIIETAKNIKKETKSFELLKALADGFAKLEEVGGNRKALIFTENKRTQQFLQEFLIENGYDKSKIVLFNGSNNSEESIKIYKEWTDKATNMSSSKSANMRMALLDYFKDKAEIMIATEAGAEGVNMQFCSMVINYDLPWNPQRIEQRIGRCHRYGQKNDVVVINFVNERNLADVRTFELLNSKFNLFDGILGASDDILGSIESGVDFERKILRIYNECRTQEEIEEAFNELQKEMEEIIKKNMEETHRKIIENFDEDVHERLKMKEIEAKKNIDVIEKYFWDLTKYELDSHCEFDDENYIFKLNTVPNNISAAKGYYELITKNKNRETEKYIPYRMNSGIGESIIKSASVRELDKKYVKFDISNRTKKISIIEEQKGKRGTLILSKFIIDGLEYEEHLLFNGYLVDGENKKALDDEFCRNLFKCEGIQEEKNIFSFEEELRQDSIQHSIAKLNQFIERNDKEFMEQEEKFYKWAEDCEKAKEAELEETKNEIKKLQRDLRKAVNMQEKEEINKEIQRLEKLKRNQRQAIFAASDEIEEKRDELIKKLQDRKKYKTNLENLFIIDFEIS